MKLTEPKEIAEFISYLNNINQDWKNFTDSSNYTIYRGNLIAMQTDVSSLVMNHYGTLDTSKLKLTADFINEIRCVINGIDFFRFLATYKKSIESIELVNGKLQINSPFIFKTKSVHKSIDINRYNDFLNKLGDTEKTDMHLYLTKDEIDQIIKKPFGVKIMVADRVKLYLSKSVINPLKGANVSIDIYSINQYPELYQVIFESTKQKYKMEGFYIIPV